MSNLVRNESIKLFANWLNGGSIAIIGAGVVAPLVSSIIGLGPKFGTSSAIATLMLICIAVGVALHLSAQRVIGRLKDD